MWTEWRTALLAGALAMGLAAPAAAQRGTGDLGLIIERETGSIQVVETTTRSSLGRVEGLGDLSHATAVFSRDGRFAYVFGRDGGLSKVDLLAGAVERRIVQAGNSIGGAISQDGRLIAVANYEPGGVSLFRADTLAPVAEIPTIFGEHVARSKVVGLADYPGQGFVFSLYDAGEIWLADLDAADRVTVRKLPGIGRLPYDGLITPDGRHYIAGLFGDDGLVMLDLWQRDMQPVRILDGYLRGDEPLPVYKMPHLRGWAIAGDLAFLPAVGKPEVLVVDRRDWRERGHIAVHGQPVFAVARPDGRQVWVNFAHPLNDVVQVIDVPSQAVVAELRPGKAVMHLEFTPRGEQVWISVRDEDRVEIYDTRTLQRVGQLPARSPSGILFAARANRIGF